MLGSPVFYAAPLLFTLGVFAVGYSTGVAQCQRWRAFGTSMVLGLTLIGLAFWTFYTATAGG